MSIVLLELDWALRDIQGGSGVKEARERCES